MRVGEIEITPLSDGVLRIPPTEILSKSIEAWQAHRELLDGRGLLDVNFGGVLVRTPRRTIVIDTGIGGGAAPGLGIGTFPANLRRAGVAASDVSDVIFTRLRFDHVGWSTDCRRPMFTGAEHHCHVLDWEYFCGPQAAVETGPGIEDFGALSAPVRLAPLAEMITLFNDEHEITTGVRVRFGRGTHRGTAWWSCARAAPARSGSPTLRTTRLNCSRTTGHHRLMSIPTARSGRGQRWRAS